MVCGYQVLQNPYSSPPVMTSIASCCVNSYIDLFLLPDNCSSQKLHQNSSKVVKENNEDNKKGEGNS